MIKRIQVVGCPRSGTTLLQSLMAAHPAITSFTESHFFTTHLNSKFGLYRIGAGLSDRISAFVLENDFDPGLLSAPGRPTPRPGIFTKRRAAQELRYCFDLFDRMAEQRGAQAWLEKTPDNLLRLPVLRLIDPHLQIVHIVRDPSETIRSYRRASAGWSGSTCSWQEAERAYAVRLRISESLVQRDRIVFYADLIENPSVPMHRLLSDLGFDISNYDFTNFAKVASSLILPAETWKQKNVLPITSTNAETPYEAPGTLRERYDILRARVRALAHTRP